MRLNIIQITHPIKKWLEDLTGRFSKQDIQMVKSHMKRGSTLMSEKSNQNSKQGVTSHQSDLLSSKNPQTGDFPGNPGVKNMPANARGMGSIPDLGNKTPRAVGPWNLCATTTEPTEGSPRAATVAAHVQQWRPGAVTTNKWIQMYQRRRVKSHWFSQVVSLPVYRDAKTTRQTWLLKPFLELHWIVSGIL